MANEYYNPSGVPGENAALSSSEIRAEFDQISQALDKLPSMSGNAGKVTVIDPTGTRLVAEDDTLLRATNVNKGADIVIAASGTVTIPAIGSYFNVVSAGGFNVTGLTTGNPLQLFNLLLPGGLNLVDSANFRLRDRQSRRSTPGELFNVIFDASLNSFVECGEAKILDLTGYAGADIRLGIGQSAFYNVTAVTDFPLRIATADNQMYELFITPTAIANTTHSGTQLLPNNANQLNQIIRAFIAHSQTPGTPSVGPGSGVFVESNFALDSASTVRNIKATISTFSNNKFVHSEFMNVSTNAWASGVSDMNWPQAVVWSILGRLLFGAPITGRIMVRRIF
jgi:hypothetical protein